MLSINENKLEQIIEEQAKGIKEDVCFLLDKIKIFTLESEELDPPHLVISDLFQDVHIFDDKSDSLSIDGTINEAVERYLMIVRYSYFGQYNYVKKFWDKNFNGLSLNLRKDCLIRTAISLRFDSMFEESLQHLSELKKLYEPDSLPDFFVIQLAETYRLMKEPFDAFETVFRHNRASKKLILEALYIGLLYPNLEQTNNALSMALASDAKNCPDILLLISRIFWKKKMFMDAVESIRCILEINPKDPIAWFTLGMIYINTRQFPEAEKSFMFAILYDKSLYESWINLGILHIQKNDMVVYQKFIDYSEKNAPSNVIRGFKKIQHDFMTLYRCSNTYNDIDDCSHINSIANEEAREYLLCTKTI